MNSSEANTKISTGSYQLNSILRIDNKAYFVPINKRVLVEYSFAEESETAMYELPEFSYDGLNPFLDIVLCCGKIVLIPNHAEIFILFDLNNKTFQKIDIPKDNINCRPWGYFTKAFVYKDKVYAIGHVYPGIVKVDVEDCTCGIVLNMSTLDKPIYRFMFDSVLYDGKVFLLSAIDNYLLVYDLDTLYLKKLKLGMENTPLYKSILINDEKLILIKNNGEIDCCDVSLIKKDNETTIQVKPFIRTDVLNSDEDIRSVVCDDSYIIGAENGSIQVLKQNDYGCEMIVLKQPYGEFNIYNFFDKGDKKVLFIDNNRLKNFKIDLMEKKITEINIASDDEKYLALGIIEKKKILAETDVSLEGFIANIIKK